MSSRDMVGQRCGSYRLVERLGEGGMGTVFAAEHVHMGRAAAIKVLLPEWSGNDVVVNRFFNEARAASMASHPGIVQIFDCGYSDDGRAYLVMERLDGESLASLLAREQTLSVRRMTAIARQLAGALGAAHDKNVVHRDLKPDNVFLVPDPAIPLGERVKVLDFGIAKLASAAHVRTQSGLVLGTPLYMSPEQCLSSEDVDARSDIYSLGCLMFEMVCGRPPFDHGEQDRVARAHVEEAPPSPRGVRAGIPASAEGIILRALAKRREDRPQTMQALHAELDVLWGLLPEGEDDAAPARHGPEIAIAAVASRPPDGVRPVAAGEAAGEPLGTTSGAAPGGDGEPASGAPGPADPGPADPGPPSHAEANQDAAPSSGETGRPTPPAETAASAAPAEASRATARPERRAAGGGTARASRRPLVVAALAVVALALVGALLWRGTRGKEVARSGADAAPAAAPPAQDAAGDAMPGDARPHAGEAPAAVEDGGRAAPDAAVAGDTAAGPAPRTDAGAAMPAAAGGAAMPAAADTAPDAAAPAPGADAGAATPTADADPDAAAAVPATGHAGPAPGTPGMVTVRVLTTPAGASVYDSADGARLGTTPFERSYPRSAEPLVLRLALPGYLEERLEVPRDRSTQHTLGLTPRTE